MRSVALVVLLVLCVALSLGDGHGCYDDVAKCTQTLKDVLLDDDLYWFGNSYATNCPAGAASTSSGCINFAPTQTNIISRLFNQTKDIDPASRVSSDLQLATVTFNTPKGSYYACGHEYHAKAAVDFRVDPGKVVSSYEGFGQYQVDTRPTIEWDSSKDPANTYYTVIAWDVGYFFAHAVYINAVGGNIESAIPVKAYSGPKNSNLQPDPYSFTVHRQQAFINTQQAFGAFGASLSPTYGALSPTNFMNLLGIDPELVAANVMSSTGDAYGMQFQKNMYISNNCPDVITSQPVFKAILDAAGVEAKWKVGSSVLHNKPSSYLTGLTVDMKAEYFLDRDVTVDSCCVKNTVSKSMFATDPLGNRTVRPIVVSQQPIVHLDQMNILGIRFNDFRNKVYSLVMVDITQFTFTMDRMDMRFYIHWMVKDIHDGDVRKGVNAMPYIGPAPPKRNQAHAYIFLLLEQTEQVLDISNVKSLVSDDCPDKVEGRCGNDFGGFLKGLGLDKIVGATWFVAEQDAFTRKNYYTMAGGMSMIGICEGQAGFEDPCPRDQYCGAAGSADSPRYGLVAIVTSAVLVLLASKMY